ncbi:MAG TPA: hypothetical protein VF607_15465, partial [Verrucomicrobiae bacterium]
ARARAQGETSGAQSGAQVAEYLRADKAPLSATEKTLSKLTLPQADAAVPPAPAVTPTVTPAQPTVADVKLSTLLQSTPPAMPAPTASPSPAPAPNAETSPAKPVDLSQADQKLSSLLGGKK